MPLAGAGRAFWLALTAALALDVLSKEIARTVLPLGLPLRVLGDWFRLHLIYNPGAAFGVWLGPYSRWILSAVSLVIIAALVRWAHDGARDRFRQEGLGLIVGGALGNLLERIQGSRGVTDFLELTAAPIHWPVFNVADIAVVVGACTLALSLIRRPRRAIDSVPAQP